VASEIKLPRLGQGMESGTIVKWLKSEGDEVQKGEPLYELDTEKVTQEVEADAGGVLLKIVVAEGEVDVGRTIAYVGEAGEAIPDTSGVGSEAAPDGAEKQEDGAAQSAEKPAEAPAREPERERARVAAAAEEAESPPPARTDGGRIKASPLARRIARERGIDLAAVGGTGPEGRIVAEDVERAAASPAPGPAVAPDVAEVEEVELTSTRRTIARRLTEAWQAPVFQLTVSANMTRALELHDRLRERRREDEAKATLSDVLTRVCASALLRHRELNAHFVDGRILRFPAAHVGIAVAAPSGLVVPVLRDCERKSVLEIATERTDVVGRAREGKLRREDLEGGTFTVSNLGMFGVEQFIAVLNPPQVAILAVGSVEERPVVEDGDLVIRPTMTLTLTCDHRAVDGAAGAEFLQTLRTFIEEPGLAL
jgi:pyruvate dehydrogenase E2 component (dihydrolipoamide acetyltransferase)